MMSGESTKRWNELGTPKEHIEEQRAEQNILQREQQVWDVAGLWFRGYTVRDISQALGLGRPTIISMLGEVRETIVEWHKADLLELAAERIEGFRSIEKEARDLVIEYPKQSSQLLSVALRSQENVAKIQGVLSDKVHHLGSVTHHVKLYNFKDNFPEAIQNLQSMETETTPAMQGPPVLTNTKSHIVVDGEVFEGDPELVPLKPKDS